MDLRFDTPFSETGLCDVPPSLEDLGIPGTRRIAPGNADASVLLRRMQITGDDRMPPIGTVVPHDQALDVIESWINGLSLCD